MGAGYLFERVGNFWQERTGVFASDGQPGDWFGTDTALLPDTAFVGSPRDDDGGEDAGSVYVAPLASFTSGFAASFCPGDGSVSYCPCNNPSAEGAGQGCANSSTHGGRIDVSGSYGVAADDLVVEASLAVQGFALLAVGDLPDSWGLGTQSGDGLRCITSDLRPLGVRFANAAGPATWGPGLGSFGGWQPGQSQFFQVHYRDAGGPCGSRFNHTNGMQVIFVP